MIKHGSPQYSVAICWITVINIAFTYGATTTTTTTTTTTATTTTTTTTDVTPKVTSSLTSGTTTTTTPTTTATATTTTLSDFNATTTLTTHTETSSMHMDFNSTANNTDTMSTFPPGSNLRQENDFLLTIIVPVAGAAGGFILLLTFIVLIVMCKRQKKLTTSRDKDNRLSGIHLNTLYISSDDIADFKTVETTNDSLSSPENPNTAGQNTEKTDEMEVSSDEQSGRAVYAVVNKKKNDTKEERPPTASCKNQDGLNYTQVEISNGSNRKPTPRVSLKENKGDSVTYTEVTVAD